MGSGKREEGASGPSTSEAALGEELQQESALYNSITASITAAGRPTAGPSSKPVIKVEVELPNAQKTEVMAAAIEVTTPSKPLADNDSSSSHGGSSDKKQKPVDLKSYMDRMKERRPGTESPSITTAATPRKSFMPELSAAGKDIEESKHADSRSADRHRSGRSNYPETNAQRQPGNNSGSSRFEPRPGSGLSKPTEHGRPHHDVSAGDNSRKRHGEPDEVGERERKYAKIGFDNGGGHSSSRYPKESSRSGGDPKVSVVPKSGHSASSNVNGTPWDDNREKQSRHYEASPAKPVQTGQVRFIFKDSSS